MRSPLSFAACESLADVAEESRRVLMEEHDHLPHEGFIVVEIIEESRAAENGRLHVGRFAS